MVFLNPTLLLPPPLYAIEEGGFFNIKATKSGISKSLQSQTDLCESFFGQNGFWKIGTGYLLQLVDFFPYERNFENGRLFSQIGLIKAL